MEPYCKHCGAKLPQGQTICHVCGKKVGYEYLLEFFLLEFLH